MSIKCPHCQAHKNTQDQSRHFIKKHGSFKRASDQTVQLRFFCNSCRKTFSSATSHPCFRQKKRHLNPMIFEAYVSGVSQRRLAKIYRCNYKTVVRKFMFLSSWAEVYFKRHRELFPPAIEVEFDDLETFEHTKFKPLSVAMMVESKTRRILGFNVAQMAPKGLLTKRAKKKYGKRKDFRNFERAKLFHELKPYIAPKATIKSDESPHYPWDIKKHFPEASHWTTKGRRGCVVGQGELKGGGFDPLFTLNHTFAMFRANINRLFRRTWNTTKKPDRLKRHIWLYVLYHNLVILE